MKARKVVYEPAFVVSTRLRSGEEDIGPDGLLTKLMTLFSPEGGPGWVFDLHHEVRRGVVRFIFKEEDRAEVERRLDQWKASEKKK